MPSTLISPTNAGYPKALAQLDEPPSLYLRGALPEAPGVAIVGTRGATAEARAFTRKLAADLVEQGLAIWSGGAIGIDAAAHEAALAVGGRTVLVSGGGLDRPYPREHRGLFDRVLESGGALLARVPDDAPPRPYAFLQRNWLLAALTEATIVIEAGIQSGARSTAAAAVRLGRPLLAVPHAPWLEKGAGCADELARGRARAVTSAAGVLEALGRPRPPVRKKRATPRPPATLPLDLLDTVLHAPPPSLSEDEATIFQTLGKAPRHLDEVCESTHLAPALVQTVLLTLTLQAVVVEGPAGFFRRAARLSPS